MQLDGLATFLTLHDGESCGDVMEARGRREGCVKVNSSRPACSAENFLEALSESGASLAIPIIRVLIL